MTLLFAKPPAQRIGRWALVDGPAIDVLVVVELEWPRESGHPPLDEPAEVLAAQLTRDPCAQRAGDLRSGTRADQVDLSSGKRSENCSLREFPAAQIPFPFPTKRSCQVTPTFYGPEVPADRIAVHDMNEWCIIC